jgi:hypothetical protein
MANPNTAGKEAANLANDRNYDELWRRLKARSAGPQKPACLGDLAWRDFAGTL